MTEYDYSPEAVERYIAKQNHISQWVAGQPRTYPNPFVHTPSQLANDDSKSPEPSRRSPRRARTHHGHGHEHEHKHHRHHHRSPSDSQSYALSSPQQRPYPSRSMTMPAQFYYPTPAVAIPATVPYSMGATQLVASPRAEVTLPSQTTVTYTYVPQYHTTTSPMQKFSSVVKRIFKAMSTTGPHGGHPTPDSSREDGGSGSSRSRGRSHKGSIEKGWAFVDFPSPENGAAIEWKDPRHARRSSTSRRSTSHDSGGRRRHGRGHSR